MIIDLISSCAGRTSQHWQRVESSEVVLYEPVHVVVIWLMEVVGCDAGNLLSFHFSYTGDRNIKWVPIPTFHHVFDCILIF